MNTDIDRSLPEFSLMQRVKRRFFAMRNGDVAQQMRQRGLIYTINFGLNIPQIVEIADAVRQEIEAENLQADHLPTLTLLADQLWANDTTRESLLIASMLQPHEAMTMGKAQRWLAQVPTTEVADILCHRLLRHMPFALNLIDAGSTDSPLTQYARLRLALNLNRLSIYPTSQLLELATKLAHNNPLCLSLTSQILAEA